MSHLLISAAHKSSGKTTISIGLTAALSEFKQVQTFKKGPDYIDPMWLSRASGRNCYNLDFYTMQQSEIKNTFLDKMSDADIGLIEGNKGLYDGLDLDGSNSNAALATLLQSPVILVLDSRGMTRGIAPLVLGYQNFDPAINIKGVILNQVGGSRHESKLRAILEHYTDVTVLGAVHKNPQLNIDERHLGLIPSNEENAADKKIRLIGQTIKEQVNLDQLLEIASTATAPDAHPESSITNNISLKNDINIGILRDEAFGFYYPDDIDALRSSGANLVFIDSIKDSALPEIDGLFIGGGFPETKMHELNANTSFMASVKNAIEDNMPVYAECGGLMYLCRKIEWQDDSVSMVGIIQADIKMHKKPQGRGYIQLSETSLHPWKPAINTGTLFAHEFHYSQLTNFTRDYPYAYHVLRGTGIDGKHDGLIYKNLLANYAHLRSTENNQWAQRFVQKIIQHKETVSTSN